ncbi:hypothetical protein AB0J82_36300 [Asanoa sp. NPDC049518]|uniref:hypothetical protein n=1 Tax=unclassified Asanoa TaxID=2685164 RepID=UPI0034487B2F
MHRTSRTTGRARKLILGGAAVALLAGGLAVTGLSNAGESCAGLDTALRNNLTFIAGQRGNPDSQSAARIENRQAVVDLIQQRRVTAGCTANVVADPIAGVPTKPAKPATAPTTKAPSGGAAGQVVCKGSTVTFFNENAGPAASSGTFPIGTRLRLTNLDNNRSITVQVTSPSGSCVLLNNAAYETVREPGKNLIRRALIERVG